MAGIVFSALEKLGLETKLLALIGDNAGPNNTLTEHLYNQLSLKYTDPF